MKITISKSQWEEMGKKAGWNKSAQNLREQVAPTVQPANQQAAVPVKNQVEKDVKDTGVLPTNLNIDQKSVLQPAEQQFKSKFKEMQPVLRDPKAKVVMYDLMDTLTNGDNAQIDQNMQKMKPILNQFKSKEEDVAKKHPEKL